MEFKNVQSMNITISQLDVKHFYRFFIRTSHVHLNVNFLYFLRHPFDGHMSIHFAFMRCERVYKVEISQWLIANQRKKIVDWTQTIKMKHIKAICIMNIYCDRIKPFDVVFYSFPLLLCIPKP